MTAQQLYNITDALRNLTAHLKLSNTNSENLKRTFKGLFAVIDIVKQAFIAVAKGVGSLLGGTGDLASSILSVTARFGDWLAKLDETIKKTDIFNVAIQTVIKYIKTGVAVATDLIDKAVDAVTRFANAIKQKYDTGGFAAIHSVLERVHTRMSEVGEAADGMRSGVEIAIGAMGKALENSKFLQALQTLWDGVKTIGTGIATPANTPEITVIPVSPFAISFQLKDAIFFNADAKINTETDNPNIIVAVFPAFLRSPLIFVKIAIDVISSANNPVNAVIDDANFAESISESTTIAPVRIAIALAILIKVPAFNCV
jgi:hypothetical protein